MGIFDKFKIGFQKSASALTSGLKEIIINVCHSVYLESLSEYLYQNSLSLYELEKKYKVKINHFPEDLTKKMFKISREVVESFSNLGNIHQEIYMSWKKALTQFNQYQYFIFKLLLQCHI